MSTLDRLQLLFLAGGLQDNTRLVTASSYATPEQQSNIKTAAGALDSTSVLGGQFVMEF